MSIRPIDVITMAPKSQEASQYQTAEQARAHHNQDAAMTSFQNQVKQNTEQTTKTTKSEEEWKFPEKDKKQKNGQNKKQNKEKDGEQKNSKNVGQLGYGSSFDIKI